MPVEVVKCQFTSTFGDFTADLGVEAFFMQMFADHMVEGDSIRPDTKTHIKKQNGGRIKV